MDFEKSNGQMAENFVYSNVQMKMNKSAGTYSISITST